MNIAIVSDLSRGLPKSIGRGFEELGHEVKVFRRKHLFCRDNLIHATLSLSSPNYASIRQWENSLRTWRPSKPLDLLIFVKGGRPLIDQDLVDRIRVDWAPKWCVLWLFDPIVRMKGFLDFSKGYDFIFSFQKSDAARLRTQGVSCEYLPPGYSPDIFFPMPRHHKYDLFFVGAYLENPYRMEILSKLAERAKQNKWLFALAGEKLNWFRPTIKRKFGNEMIHLKPCRILRNLHPKTTNWYYNNARICLNIHDAPERGSPNPRSFNILGAGACELVDYRFEDPDLLVGCYHWETYRDCRELIEKVTWLLESPKRRRGLGQAGYEEVKAHHTFRHRALAMLRMIGIT